MMSNVVRGVGLVLALLSGSAVAGGNATVEIQRRLDDCWRSGGGTVTLTAGVFNGKRTSRLVVPVRSDKMLLNPLGTKVTYCIRNVRAFKRKDAGPEPLPGARSEVLP